MVQYCRKCGNELDDDAEFCDSCGFNLNSNPNDNQTKETETTNTPRMQNDKTEFVTKLPLILAIIGIIVSVAEGLGTPMLMGWDNIMMAMAVGILGGLLGIYLMEKLDEPLIAAVEFIATGALIYMFIARFGEISAILFIIAAVLTLYFKGYYAKNKKLWSIPILTVILIFMLLIAGGALYQSGALHFSLAAPVAVPESDDPAGSDLLRPAARSPPVFQQGRTWPAVQCQDP